MILDGSSCEWEKWNVTEIALDPSVMGGIGPVDERPADCFGRMYVAGAGVCEVVESRALVGRQAADGAQPELAPDAA
jgi:hypothetical protein